MRTVIHPGYNKPVPLANDIALVRLRRALPVASVALAQRSQDPKQNTVVSIAGWGCLRESTAEDTEATCSAPDAFTNKLQQTNVSIVAGPYCAGTMSPVDIVINPARQVCASQFNGPPQDACLFRRQWWSTCADYGQPSNFDRGHQLERRLRLVSLPRRVHPSVGLSTLDSSKHWFALILPLPLPVPVPVPVPQCGTLGGDYDADVPPCTRGRKAKAVVAHRFWT